MKKVIAFFDFDGTLINVDSMPRFLWYCTSPTEFIKKSTLLIPVLAKYILGGIDSQSAKENIYKVFFAGIHLTKFMDRSLSFSRDVIPSLENEKAIARLKWHLDNKHECVLISASIQDYIMPWAERKGFSKIIATRLETDEQGIVTGKFMGKNCKGPEKVRRIKEWLGEFENYEIYAYGDNSGDKELLEIADYKYYKSFNEEKSYPGE